MPECKAGCGYWADEEYCVAHRGQTAECPDEPFLPVDAVNPAHYRDHPSGVDCIQITEHMNFCLGNVFKYIWRAGSKGVAVEDLRKAAWYLDREIKRLDGNGG